jgi:hypothetical protein
MQNLDFAGFEILFFTLLYYCQIHRCYSYVKTVVASFLPCLVTKKGFNSA